MTHFLSQNDTDSCFDDFTFEHAFVVFVMEYFDISGAAIVQTIFDGNIINKCFILLGCITGRHFSTDDDTETVVPETFGKLEVVIKQALPIIQPL